MVRHLLFSLFLLAAATPAIAGAAPPPNFVVVFVDDLGYADVGAQRQASDVRTPQIDRVCESGVRCTAGYITAPQCSPSRAGLITGRYQQRFGLNHIPDCPLPLGETTLAERLKPAGYTSGMVGKWHLAPNLLSVDWARRNGAQINKKGQAVPGASAVLAHYPRPQGFDDFFVGERDRYYANYDLRGEPLRAAGEWRKEAGYRLDIQTDAALAFIRRNRSRPFFLFLNYFAPHVPLVAPPKYLDRFPGEMPERRRHALAMISAMDDGVGRIMRLLRETGVEENTLVVFTSDNGAPLRLTMPDERPIDSFDGSWDGSLNTPWVGEKGMLSEGGIRVPMVWRWKGVLPAGMTYDQPVTALDIASTAVAAAGLPASEELDGVDIVPFLTGQQAGPPHDLLYWRFWSQAAVRSGKWKYLRAGGAYEFLFDLESPEHELRNLIEEHPETAQRLRAALGTWTADLRPAGIPQQPLNDQEARWYRHYFGAATPDAPTARGGLPGNGGARRR